MVRIGPWNRLPLTVRWLKQEYCQEFSLNKLPPTHMPIVYGLIEMFQKSSKSKKNEIIDPSITDEALIDKCFICKSEILKESLIGVTLATILKCFKCEQISHTVCMAKHFIVDNQILPVEGNCPKCYEHLMWGDLIKNKVIIKRSIITDNISQEEDNEDDDEEEDDFVERDDEDDDGDGERE